MSERRKYRLVLENDAARPNAVTIDIGEEPWLSPLPASCSVSWPAIIKDGASIDADKEGPYSVIEALKRADQIAEQYGFADVLVRMAKPDRWNSAWGELVR